MLVVVSVAVVTRSWGQILEVDITEVAFAGNGNEMRKH